MNKTEKIKFYQTQYKYGVPSHCTRFNWGSKYKTCHLMDVKEDNGHLTFGREVYKKCVLPDNEQCPLYKKGVHYEV